MFYERGIGLSSRSLFLFILDIVAVIGSMLLSSFIRLGWEDGTTYFLQHYRVIAASAGIFLLVFYITGLYERQILVHKKGSFAGILIGVAISMALVIVFLLRQS